MAPADKLEFNWVIIRHGPMQSSSRFVIGVFSSWWLDTITDFRTFHFPTFQQCTKFWMTSFDYSSKAAYRPKRDLISFVIVDLIIRLYGCPSVSVTLNRLTTSRGQLRIRRGRETVDADGHQHRPTGRPNGVHCSRSSVHNTVSWSRSCWASCQERIFVMTI